MRSSMSIAVIIPALNEEATLPGVLGRIPAWVDRVIVVDNGSTDSTARTGAEAGAMVMTEPKRGYGRACLAGIRAAERAGANILVFLDADGSDYPEQMDRLIDPITQGRADLVIGSRRLGLTEPGAMSPPQKIGNLLAPALIRLFWGVRFTDLGPFRAVRAAALAQLRMDDPTYGWTVQMQIRAARFGLRCAEAPVDYSRRRGGKSKISGTFTGVMSAGVKIIGCVAHERLHPPIRRPPTLERLAVLTKHPEAGLVKTRLIPALGAQGAADLHARFIEHTLSIVRRFTESRGPRAEVWLGGGDASPGFEARFGSGWNLRAQPEGDLGARMARAFASMLADASAAVIIGTDCPELSPGVLHDAFEALVTHDLVLGPATDGGYYLIGLRRPVPALFEAMTWSTGEVCAETIRRAQALDLRIATLPPLDDVDEPDDLCVWERVCASEDTGGAAPELSIVIPALNEVAVIAEVIEAVIRGAGASREGGVEVIVADGGSVDGTRRVARECGARVVLSARGRGPQLNAGAAVARAPRLLFLHADTALPTDYLRIVTRTLESDGVAVGAFRFRVDLPGPLLRCVEAAVALRCALLRTPYGDQALFMRRDVFRALGGFAPIPLMEDLDFLHRAKSRYGRRAVTVASEQAVTSGRRWAAAGVLRMTLVNQGCIMGFALGVSPVRLARWRNRLSGSQRPPSPSMPGQ